MFLAKARTIMSISLLFVLLFSGCETGKINQGEQYNSDMVVYTIMVRFDKQNEIYYQMAKLLEGYIQSENRDIEEVRFSAFCLGVNCLIRDEVAYSLYDQLFQDDEGVIRTVKKLMSITAKNEIDTLQISELPDNEMERLKTNFYELAKCCDRGKEDSLAYHITNQDFESDSYKEAVNRVEKLLKCVDEITK